MDNLNAPPYSLFIGANETPKATETTMTTTTKPAAKTTTAAALATIDAAKAALKRTPEYARWAELDREIGRAITARDAAKSVKRVREDGTPVQSRAIAKHQAIIDALTPEWQALDDAVITQIEALEAQRRAILSQR